jgi:hypothetical protein
MGYIARIYKIVNNVNEEIYIGSTKNELRVRFQQHKNVINTDAFRHLRLYQLMNEIGKDKFRIIEMLKFLCEDKAEQLRKEQEFIDDLKPTLNKSNACGFNFESSRKYKRIYYQEHKQEKKEYDKKNREMNKEQMNEKRRGYCYDCDKYYNRIGQHYKTQSHLQNTLPLI